MERFADPAAVAWLRRRLAWEDRLASLTPSERPAGDRHRAPSLRNVARLVEIDEGRYTLDQVARRAGVSVEGARRLWRALGFPEPAEGEPAFSEADLVALRTIGRLLEDEMVDGDLLLQMARVTGHSLARVATAQAAAIRDQVATRVEAASNEPEAVETLDAMDEMVPVMEELLRYAWARHLTAAATQHSATLRGEGDRQVAVGFGDLVGFTRLSEEHGPAELTRLVDRFEATAFDIVGRHGGRVVKLIGDEVMFTASDAAAAAEIGLALSQACTGDPELPDLRVGLAHGPSVAIAGDEFGPTVNLANRLVAAAEPGTVVVSEGFRAAVENQGYRFSRLPRARRFKGIGPLAYWLLLPQEKAAA